MSIITLENNASRHFAWHSPARCPGLLAGANCLISLASLDLDHGASQVVGWPSGSRSSTPCCLRPWAWGRLWLVQVALRGAMRCASISVVLSRTREPAWMDWPERLSPACEACPKECLLPWNSPFQIPSGTTRSALSSFSCLRAALWLPSLCHGFGGGTARRGWLAGRLAWRWRVGSQSERH